MDSTESPVYGQQENSAYNGHFESTCYHPLLLFNREGDCLAAKLRPGNVHSAVDWEELLLPEIERQQKLGKEVVFRADAAFAKPEIYEALEERGVKYAIRIPANENLERDISELLTRPVGRPSHMPVVWYKGFLYQAASWKTARRVVAKVEFHFGELFPRVGFIVTNLETDSLAVVRFYNKRGTAEQWIKEGKQAVKMTRLSCHRFRSNEVRLWQPDRVQPGEPVAAAGAAEEDRELVAYQLAAAAGEDRVQAGQARTVLLADAGREPPHAAALRCDGASHCGATRDWVGRSVCCRIQQRRREAGEVSMKLAVGVELASLERLAAVEKCSRLSGQRLSDLKTYNSGSRKGPSVYTEWPGQPIMEILD
jgi:hypothetical protein